MVGHSERREYHGETNELIGAKAKKALEAGLTPIHEELLNFVKGLFCIFVSQGLSHS